MSKLVIQTEKAVRARDELLRALARRNQALLRKKEPPWIPTPGQPVPVMLDSTVTSAPPQGGCGQLTGQMDSTGTYYLVRQPTYPGISASLVIFDSAIPLRDSAGNAGSGLAWPMDGCVHPTLLPTGDGGGLGIRYDATPGQWYASRNPIGPLTTVGVSLTGTGPAVCHGQRGASVACFGWDNATQFVRTIILGTEITGCTVNDLGQIVIGTASTTEPKTLWIPGGVFLVIYMGTSGLTSAAVTGFLLQGGSPFGLGAQTTTELLWNGLPIVDPSAGTPNAAAFAWMKYQLGLVGGPPEAIQFTAICSGPLSLVSASVDYNILPDDILLIGTMPSSGGFGQFGIYG